MGLASFVRPVVRGKRGWIEGVKQPWNGGTLELNGPELDAGDLGVLLSLLALALRHSVERGAEIATGGDVPGLLPAPGGRPGENRAADCDVMLLQTTLAAICREIGRDPNDGRAHAAIRKSIKRLQGFVIEARSGDRLATTHLIADTAGRSKGAGAVSVALSYRLARAVIGEGSYGRVRMGEWRELSPTAQCLYHFLACWRPGYGQCPTIGLDTIARHVWGAAPATGAVLRDRRRMLRAALSELPREEWEISEAEADRSMVRIERKNIDPQPEPVFSPTPTRVSAHAPHSEKPARISLPHERGRESPGQTPP
uniref:Replication C family protein n=1 Tax=Thiomonas intermedia (strain K12) TaxID=75379 RepID=D5X4Y3_THIK1